MNHSRLIDTATSIHAAKRLVEDELSRQRDELGFTPEHDDTHVGSEILRAAGLYVHAAIIGSGSLSYGAAGNLARSIAWPFTGASFKPSPTKLNNMVKAAALLQAEIARCLRAGEDKAPPLGEWKDVLDILDRNAQTLQGARARQFAKPIVERAEEESCRLLTAYDTFIEEVKETIQQGVATLARDAGVNVDWDTHSIILPFRYTLRLRQLYVESSTLSGKNSPTPPDQLVNFSVSWANDLAQHDLVFVKKSSAPSADAFCVTVDDGASERPIRYPIL